MLTANETSLLKELLDAPPCSGCNDFEMPNTEENRGILRAATIWNANGNEETANEDLKIWCDRYEKGGDEENSPTIMTSDFLIEGYLRSKIGL